MVVSAGWYVAIVELWPAAAGPTSAARQGNSVLELALGYNGLGRIFGRGCGGGSGAPARPPAGGRGRRGRRRPRAGVPRAAVPAAGGGGFGGQAGLLRLFNTEIGGQVSWLLPAALALLVVGMWLTRRRPRTDRGPRRR